MAIESVVANAGSGGSSFAADTITGSVLVPYAKLMSGTDTSEELIGGDAANGLDVDVTRVSGTVAVSNAGLTELAAAINASSQMDVNIAASNATVTVTGTVTANMGTVTADPFGANADAASATGSISAKLRFIASTGIPITGTVTVGSHAVTNAGTFATQVDGAALTALQVIDNPVLVDDAAFTPATSSVMMAGFEADEGSTDSVDEGDAGAARMTLDRKQITTPQPHTAGGLTVFRSLDLDETEEDVKTSAGQIYGWIITNFATSTRYVKFSNATAANTTVGSTAVFMTVPVPGNASDDTTLVQNFGGMGIPFDTALCAYATTGLADNDTGAPSANDVAITVLYK